MINLGFKKVPQKRSHNSGYTLRSSDASTHPSVLGATPTFFLRLASLRSPYSPQKKRRIPANVGGNYKDDQTKWN